MKNIRRSLNKDRIGAPTPTYSSLPTTTFSSVQQAQAPSRPSTSTVRPAAAPAPPKRVIRAVQAYRGAGSQELSFEVGDFFHVVSDDGGDDWYDAANPMTGARGMVPSSHFQVLGRNVRETAQGVTVTKKSSQSSPAYGRPSLEEQQGQRSGDSSSFGQKGFAPPPAPAAPQHHNNNFAPPPRQPSPPPVEQRPTSSQNGNGSRSRPPSQPAPKSQPLYGIVQYDFVAERADELDAKRGEPIIVIAQSNHEWFVAKPIGRLGGPGLIPVAFVEIQDMTTGKPVENVEELIRSAVVPKVEEWKKMTADYKSASIPLGRFDFATTAAVPPKSSPSGSSATSSQQQQQQQQQQQHQSQHQHHQQQHSNGSGGEAFRNPRTSSAQGHSPAPGSMQSNDAYDDDDRDPNARYSWTRERRQYGLVTSASVESFHQEEGSFWFHLRAFFSTGASLVLYRLYQDFYEFQIGLMDEFPVEAGRVPPGGEGSQRPLERILPMMPGPTDFEDEVVCAQRVHDLSIYLGDLCALPDRIRATGLMYEFFVPRAGDVEVAVGKGDGSGQGRVSIEGQYGELVEYLDQMDRPASGGLPDVGGMNLNGGGGENHGGYMSTPQGASERQSSGSKASGYSDPRGSSQYDDGQYHQQHQSYQQQQQPYPSPPAPQGQYADQNQNQNQAPLGNANLNVAFVKIKIFHRNTDDLIAIRVPPTVSHASLLEKVRERLGSDVVNLRYREEVGSQSGPAGGGQVVMAGGARLIGIDSDSDLERWIRGGTRLVLSNPFQDGSPAERTGGAATLAEPAPTGARRYQLTDSYAGSMQSMPTGSTYSLAGEEKDYDDAFRGGDDDEGRPLREDYPSGVYRPEGQSFGTDESYGMPNPNNYPNPSGSLYQTGGQGLTRKQTTAEAWQQRQRINPRRAMTKKVKLTPQGNFISEFPVPTAVKNANLSSGVLGGPTEFSHMRYTAACCDPNDFTPENGYSLRASSYGRQTDLLVCITAYNENKILLARTLHALMVNIRDMVKGNFSEFRKKAEKAGGPESGRSGEAWKRIVVCLVFDGIGPADKAALDVLALIGLFQDGIMKKDVDGKETVAHIFEYTTQLSMSSKPALVEPHPNDPNNLVPVQMIFCLKQKNAKKINSHRWLFNAIGKHLQPEVVCLLDAGTKPGKRSIYYLWEAFHHNENLGGACGEIHAMLGKNGRKLLNPLVAAQNFEYKYFHGDQTLAARLGPKGVNGMSIWTKNMFLAEDRILCFELVAKANEKWVLGYVKPAKGETDVPETAAELISQRRRWLNGSFAAGVYSLAHFGRLYKSDHGVIRLFFLHIQAIYNTVQLIMSWFAVANYYLTFSIIINIVATSLRRPDLIDGGSADEKACWGGSFIDASANPTSFDWLNELNWVFNVIYLIFLALQIVLALGNRPKAEKLTYTISISVYAFFSLYLILNTVELTVKAFCPLGKELSDAASTGQTAFSVFFNGSFAPIFAGIAGTFGIYIISSILYLDPWHILHSMPPFLLIAASFTNILNIYAFCNLHDVSYGSKSPLISGLDALPSATSKKDGKEATVEVQEKVQEDIDSTFKATVIRAIAPFDEHEEVEAPSMDDLNKTFRTRFICAWLLMNAVLALAITRLGTNVQTRYFQTILWITFGLACVRMSGLLWYLVGESVFRLGRLCSRR
ncbi:hypothetical protein RQP46_006413 [Phenoliferia psychrophenolica]